MRSRSGRPLQRYPLAALTTKRRFAPTMRSTARLCRRSLPDSPRSRAARDSTTSTAAACCSSGESRGRRARAARYAAREGSSARLMSLSPARGSPPRPRDHRPDHPSSEKVDGANRLPARSCGAFRGVDAPDDPPAGGVVRVDLHHAAVTGEGTNVARGETPRTGREHAAWGLADAPVDRVQVASLNVHHDALTFALGHVGGGELAAE